MAACRVVIDRFGIFATAPLCKDMTLDADRHQDKVSYLKLADRIVVSMVSHEQKLFY